VSAPKPLRVLLDVNVLVSDILSRSAGRTGTTSQKLIGAMLEGVLGGHDVQLVLSVAMIDSFRDVLTRLGADHIAIDQAANALFDLVRNGPDALDPFLLLDRSDVVFPLRDREDAAVLATAFAASADLLVTDNLKDFETQDCEVIPTTLAKHSSGAVRQLSCQIHCAPDGHVVMVAHPLDVVTRAMTGKSILFEDLRQC
jgi:predicted nucleic acid-binding protein